MSLEEEQHLPLTLSDEDHPSPDGREECLIPKGTKESCEKEKTFLKFFITSKGAPQVIVICCLMSFGYGSTVGVGPAVIADRYARLNYGYDGKSCSLFTNDERPEQCLSGFDDAQKSAAIASMMKNLFTLIMSAVVGSISDSRGRKGLLAVGIFISMLSSVALIMIQLIQSMSPIWYYAADSAVGLVGWFTISFSVLSDVMPPLWRAPSFGLLLTGFLLGFSVAPALATIMDRLTVSILGLSLMLVALCYELLCLDETLPKDVMEKAARLQAEKSASRNCVWSAIHIVCRPVSELSILNRNRFFRLLSVVAFFSGFIFTSDITLLIYYVESHLGFDDKDIASMFLINGILGILVQAILLKLFIKWVGERYVVIIAFLFGAIQNFLYGIAKSKSMIYLAKIMSSFNGMAFPTISSMKSYNVEEEEQGRIQGALFSLTALADALGPITLRFIYQKTKDSSNNCFGPGSMFIFASFLYVVGSFFACALPPDQSNSRNKENFNKSSKEQASDEILHIQQNEYFLLEKFD